MSFCHLVPPQDTKCHKVVKTLNGILPFSMPYTEKKYLCLLEHIDEYRFKHRNVKILQTKIKFGNHGNNKNGIKADIEAYKEDSDKIISFWKNVWDNCGFHGISASILDLVAMATNKIV